MGNNESNWSGEVTVAVTCIEFVDCIDLVYFTTYRLASCFSFSDDISEILVSFRLLSVCGLIFQIACRLSCIFWTCEVSFERASCASVNCSAIRNGLLVLFVPDDHSISWRNGMTDRLEKVWWIDGNVSLNFQSGFILFILEDWWS